MDLIVAAREAQTAGEKNMGSALDRFYSEHMDQVPTGDARAMDFLTMAQANAANIERALLPLYEQFRDQSIRQENLVQRFQYLSPAIMMQLALNEISGTSTARYQDFLDQAFRFRSQWNDYFAGRFLERVPLRPADYDQFPSFRYVPEPLATVLGRLAPSLAGLLLLCAGVGLLPLAGLRRYQVAAR